MLPVPATYAFDRNSLAVYRHVERAAQFDQSVIAEHGSLDVAECFLTQAEASFLDLTYPWTKTDVDEVLATPGLSDADRVAILGGTAKMPPKIK